MVIRCVGVLALLAVGLVGGSAAAEPVPRKIKLRFNAPAECPDDLELVRIVEGFLGQPLQDAREQQLAIDVRAQGGPVAGYTASLTFISQQGSIERNLEHPDCGKLTEAAGLLIALAIDPERVKARQDPTAGHVPEVAAAAPAAEPLAPPANEPAPALLVPATVVDRTPTVQEGGKRAELHPSLSLLGLTGSGLLPSVAPGIGAEFALRFGHFEVGVGGRYWLSRGADVPQRPSSSVDISLATVGLRACAVPIWGDWLLLGCARGEWGRMSAVGQHVDDARPRSDYFASLGGSLAVGRTLGRLTPLGGVDLFWAASRPRFGVLSDGAPLQAFRPQTWGLLGFIGLAYAL